MKGQNRGCRGRENAGVGGRACLRLPGWAKPNRGASQDETGSCASLLSPPRDSWHWASAAETHSGSGAQSGRGRGGVVGGGRQAFGKLLLFKDGDPSHFPFPCLPPQNILNISNSNYYPITVTQLTIEVLHLSLVVGQVSNSLLLHISPLASEQVIPFPCA